VNHREHWEAVYRRQRLTNVSWFQPHPTLSLALIEATGVGKDERIIDVGSGASILVDCLIDAGFRRVSALDISGAALDAARRRLGLRATEVEWLEADVTRFESPYKFALWHDRALFHFLIDAEDRARYVATLKRTLLLEGQVILATFAMAGPSRCSGLEVTRYDATRLCTVLGEEFALLQAVPETHRTPSDTEQEFMYFRLRRTLPSRSQNAYRR
jgi:SAM-dependent methyltransferase